MAAQWNYRELLWATGFGLFFQALILPEMSAIGDARGAYAGWFDLLFIARVILARIRHETGKGWVFYSILMLSSAAWIWGIVYLMLGSR